MDEKWIDTHTKNYFQTPNIRWIWPNSKKQQTVWKNRHKHMKWWYDWNGRINLIRLFFFASSLFLIFFRWVCELRWCVDIDDSVCISLLLLFDAEFSTWNCIKNHWNVCALCYMLFWTILVLCFVYHTLRYVYDFAVLILVYVTVFFSFSLSRSFDCFECVTYRFFFSFSLDSVLSLGWMFTDDYDIN